MVLESRWHNNVVILAIGSRETKIVNPIMIYLANENDIFFSDTQDSIFTVTPTCPVRR